MKRIIHIACLNKAQRNLGVAYQMDIERKAAKFLNLDWTVELWTSDQIDLIISKRLPYLSHHFIARRIYFLLQLKKAVRKYDIVIMRYMPLDFFSLFLSRKERQKIITLFHAKEATFFGTSELKSKLLRKINSKINRYILRDNLGIAAVTHELINYYTSMTTNYTRNYVYPNGHFITNSDVHDLEALSRNHSVIKIAFIASSFYQWNGLEELLDNIDQSVIDRSYQLILVGSLTDKQRQMISQSSANIIHFSSLDTSELDALLQDVNVTLGAFNLHSVDLKEACTLKVRKSLGLGIPVYSGHIDTGLPSDFPFYFVGPPSIDGILDYVRTLNSPSKQEVAAESIRWISKIELLSKFHEQILNDGLE